jgi:hypothetical protein
MVLGPICADSAFFNVLVCGAQSKIIHTGRSSINGGKKSVSLYNQISGGAPHSIMIELVDRTHFRSENTASLCICGIQTDYDNKFGTQHACSLSSPGRGSLTEPIVCSAILFLCQALIKSTD